MSTYDQKDGWHKRLDDSILISKMLLRWASREELVAFGYDIGLVEVIMAYRAALKSRGE